MVNTMHVIMDRVLIRLEQTKQQTDGGVLLIDELKKRPSIGYVEDVGEKVRSVKKGDKVFFYVFDDLPSLEKNIVVVRERSLLGKIEEKA